MRKQIHVFLETSSINDNRYKIFPSNGPNIGPNTSLGTKCNIMSTQRTILPNFASLINNLHVNQNLVNNYTYLLSSHYHVVLKGRSLLCVLVFDART